MKILAATFAVAALAASISTANAKGCLKGAVVGGVAGHYAGHHGVLGAIAGCAYGRHRANEQDRRLRRQRARSCKILHVILVRAADPESVATPAPLRRPDCRYRGSPRVGTSNHWPSIGAQ